MHVWILWIALKSLTFFICLFYRTWKSPITPQGIKAQCFNYTMPINTNKFHAKDLCCTSAKENISLLPFQAQCHTLPGCEAIKMSSVAATDIRHRCKISCWLSAASIGWNNVNICFSSHLEKYLDRNSVRWVTEHVWNQAIIFFTAALFL